MSNTMELLGAAPYSPPSSFHSDFLGGWSYSGFYPQGMERQLIVLTSYTYSRPTQAWQLGPGAQRTAPFLSHCPRPSPSIQSLPS